MADSSNKMQPSSVRQVLGAFEREFRPRIDMSDTAGRPDAEREARFRTRALAALVTQSLLECSAEKAARSLIDAYRDNGIDAIAVQESPPRLWLVQAKWSDTGKAGFKQGEALKLLRGWSLLDRRAFDTFNARIEQMVPAVVGVLNDSQAEIGLVVATMGDHQVSDEVRETIDLELQTVNDHDYGPPVRYKFLTARDIWQMVRDKVAEPPISLSVTMPSWMRITDPYDAFYGTVLTSQIADWYEHQGDRLFHKNIRQPLGSTSVNRRVVDGLCSSPEDFWYLNNGITILCETLQSTVWSKQRPKDFPIKLDLSGVSIVNGAQTVSAIHQAMSRDSEVPDGYVGVRVISLSGCPAEFSDTVTRATNTQNHVEPRDFAALDPIQGKIRDDFALTLEKSYVYKRGAADPPPNAGCSIQEAAYALACAHRNPSLVARVNQNPDVLWDEDTCQMLFDGPPSAELIWRLVLIYRTVFDQLHQLRGSHGGRVHSVADQGRLLCTFVLVRKLGVEVLEAPEEEWLEYFHQTDELTRRIMALMVQRIDDLFGPAASITSTFRNPERCHQLATEVLSGLELGAEARLPSKTLAHRKRRRPNTVPILVDSGRISEGTRLTFAPRSTPAQHALADWLRADERRNYATWVNHRARPLVWEADGAAYSPTGLVQAIWQAADWKGAPVAVNGPAEWTIAGQGNLVELADAILQEILDQ